MNDYIVSARKYRPSTFASVVGQKALTSTLKNAVTSGRLASSYLFCGSRGVGKTTCARIFAKAINCEHLTADGEPCNECASCLEFNNGTSLNIIEMDAASNNGVDDIRQLVSQVQVPPSNGRYRVFIVDEVHMLSSGAFNAFLKTLEEPPSYVVFILATTEKHKIIPTILSRCQIYDFRRITINDMIDHMQYVASQEGIEAEPSALNIIAQKADGAMRDALSIFDQIAASTRGHITYQDALDNLNMLDARIYSKLLDAFLQQRVLDTWMIYKEVRDRGFDSLFFINGLGEYFRNLLAASTPQTLALVEANPELQKTLTADAAKCKPEFLLKAMNLCNEADLAYRTSSGKQFLIELTLAKICQLLSPSPFNGDESEGHLKPIDAAIAPAASAAVAPPAPAPAPSAPKATTTIASAHKAAPASSSSAPAFRPASAAPMSPPPSMKGRRTSLNMPGISINKSAQPAAPQKEVEKQDAPAVKDGPRENYSADELRRAWDKFIADHPKEHVIINAMQSSRPQPTDVAHNYTVTVLNPLQRNELNAMLPTLLNHLQSMLRNVDIRIEVKVNEGAPPKHTLSDRDLLNDMIKESPMLSKYIETFNLKLS